MSLSRGLAPLVMAAAIGAGPIAAAHAAKDDLFLVNRASGATGVAGNHSALNASTSADGRFVAFESRAANLSDEDNDGVSDVFVRDLRTRSTILVSRGNKGVIADGNSYAPAISADGRFVAFQSGAGNLTVDDDDAVRGHLRPQPRGRHDGLREPHRHGRRRRRGLALACDIR